MKAPKKPTFRKWLLTLEKMGDDLYFLPGVKHPPLNSWQMLQFWRSIRRAGK